MVAENLQDTLMGEEPKEEEDPNVFYDVAMAPFRGAEGALYSAYQLADDYLLNDVLPDWETRALGTSKTIPGMAVEGVSQFVTGWFPFLRATKGLALAGKGAKALRGIGTAAAADFTAFVGQENRLSNLIQQVPELQNPVTEFLAHDADEGEIEGRLKNVLEGLGLEALGFAFIRGLKAVKDGKAKFEETGSEDAVRSVVSERLEGGKGLAFADMPSFTVDGFRRSVTSVELDEFRTQQKIPEIKLRKTGAHPTQIATTKATYEKVKPELKEGSTIDFGAGKNIAVKAGIKADSFEPFPEKGFEPTFKDSSKIPSNSYDNVINNAVLNVVPQDIRDDLVSEIGRILKVGGKAFINVRGKDVFDSKHTVISKENMEVIVDSTGAYQKGFTKEELVGYLGEVLGDGFDVKASTKFGTVAAEVTKKSEVVKDLPEFREKRAEPELQQKLDDLGETIEDFDEAIDRTPRPFKTYEEEAMMDIIPKGAGNLKSRLMKKFPIKGADPEDVADVEKFIDVMGQRLFGDVSLSITNKIPSAGRYNFGNNLLQIRQSVIDEGGIKRTMVHELWHGLSRYLPKADVTALTKQFDKARRDYIKSFGVDLDEGVDPSTLLKRTIPKELERFLKGKYTSENYRFKDVDEYFAEEMTDAFLKKLDEKDLAPTGTLKRIAQEVAILFKDMFASLKAKLGIDQRQKIFNDFIKQRNVKIQRQRPLDGRMFADLPDFKPNKADEFLNEIPEHFREYVGAVLRGQSIDMPQFRTDNDGYVLKEILDKIAENDPDFVKQYTKDWKDTDTFKTGDEVVDNAYAGQLLNLDPIEATKLARQQQAVWRVEGKGLVAKVLKARDEVRDSGFGEIPAANLKNAFQELVEFADRYRRLGREASLLLGERREKFRGVGRKVGLDEAEILTDGVRREYLNKNGNWTKKARELVEILKYVDPEDLDGAIKTVTGIAKKSQGKSWLDMPLEYWMNSILSGSAQIVNAVGASFTGTMHTLETALGGLLTGTPRVAKEALAGWADMSSVHEGFKLYIQALKNDRTFFNQANKFDLREPAIIPERFGLRKQQSQQVADWDLDQGLEPMNQTSKAYKAIDMLGKVIRFPSRHLTAQDTFFKTMFARRELRLRLALDAMKDVEAGVPKEVIAERIQKQLSGLIDENGKVFSEETLIREGLAEADAKGLKGDERAKYAMQYKQSQSKSVDTYNKLKAVGMADHLTMMEELKPGIARSLQNMTNAHPSLKLVLPFIRTPTNILNYAVGRTPLGKQFYRDIKTVWKGTKDSLEGGALDNAYDDLAKALESTDPLVKARAQGRLAVSAITVGVVTDAYFNNRLNITGGGPKDEKEIAQLKQTGWRPYSIKVGDTYYSYVKLDPYATILGSVADLVETGIKEEKGFDESGMEHLMSALIVTVQRNIFNKSYMTGLDTLVKLAQQPENYADYALQSFGSSLVPFSSALGRLNEYQGDQVSREINSLKEAVLYKIPGQREKLDPKRNILGEVMVSENVPLFGVINPIAYSTEKSDAVLTEMANLKHAFRQPSSRREGGMVEMLNFTNANGQSSYDRWLELTGTIKIGRKNLNESLEKLINSKQYNRLLPFSPETGLESPRVKAVRNMIGKYRSRAFNQMLKESYVDEDGIELSDIYERVNRAKIIASRGASREDVLALLTQ